MTPPASPDRDALAVDVAIFGGGIAGLWLLSELRRAGYRTVLIEKDALGTGQTVCAQGIIHSGLKYTLRGKMTASAQAIKEMPGRWRKCLAGQAQPDLSNARIRSDTCYLWRTQSLSSKLGMVGARAGLKVKPVRLEAGDVPEVLRQCPGGVFQLDEPVVAPETVLEALRAAHEDYIVQGAVSQFENNTSKPPAFTLHGMTVSAKRIVLTAGAGNAALRSALGLSSPAMQRRPLHMVLMRGGLPMIQGHCVDGAKTRATITADRDTRGRVVWQVGGQISEDGVAMDRETLLRHAIDEIKQVLPNGFSEAQLHAIEWATYRIDRAEKENAGKRPEDHAVVVDGNVYTCWPTKMVLAPVLAADILSRLDPPAAGEEGAAATDVRDALAALPKPKVANAPWENNLTWTKTP